MTPHHLYKKHFLIIGATLAWVAVVLQYYLILQNSAASVPETTIRFFSFFTILTNTLVAIYFSVMLGRASRLKNFFLHPGTLTAITVYITVVGIVYQFVLRKIWEPQGLQMVIDELLHTVNPLYFILFWFLFEDKLRVNWHQIPAWLIYPLLYLVYILGRGYFSGFYPYPFVNLEVLGFAEVALNSVVLLCVFVGFSAMYIGIGKRLKKDKIQAVSNK